MCTKITGALPDRIDLHFAVFTFSKRAWKRLLGRHEYIKIHDGCMDDLFKVMPSMVIYVGFMVNLYEYRRRSKKYPLRIHGCFVKVSSRIQAFMGGLDDESLDAIKRRNENDCERWSNRCSRWLSREKASKKLSTCRYCFDGAQIACKVVPHCWKKNHKFLQKEQFALNFVSYIVTEENSRSWRHQWLMIARVCTAQISSIAKAEAVYTVDWINK